MEQVIVVGAGLSAMGACAALIQKGQKPLVLDYGKLATLSPEASTDDLLVGRNSNELSHLGPNNHSPSPLLNMPAFSHSTEPYLSASNSHLTAVRSRAFGGLANAWGAGSFRFNDEDLTGFPFSKKDIDPIYDQVGQWLSVSWDDDALTPDLGAELTPANLGKYSPLSTEILNRYKRKKESSPSEVTPDFLLGRPHLAMNPAWPSPSPEEMHGHHPLKRVFFNPQHTFNQWIQAGLIEYRPNIDVLRIEESQTGVRIECCDVNTQSPIYFSARQVFLAAGTLSTAEIINRSLKKAHLQLPLLDNRGLMIPFFFFQRVSDSPSRSDRIPTFQMTSLFKSPAHYGSLVANFLDLAQQPFSELVRYFPLPVNVLLALESWVRKNLIIAYAFFPCEPQDAGTLRFSGDHKEIIPPQNKIPTRDVRALIQGCRSLGLKTFLPLAKRTSFGSSLHYAGTFPFASKPAENTTDALGRLSAFKNVHLVDGSVFPRLPAKNYSMTLIANAFRTALSALKP